MYATQYLSQTLALQTVCPRRCQVKPLILVLVDEVAVIILVLEGLVFPCGSGLC